MGCGARCPTIFDTVPPDGPAVYANFGEEERLNVLRLARRNRDAWDRTTRVVMAACADRVIDSHEIEAIAEELSGGKALGAVVDLNDCRGRATSKEQLDALNRETEVWIERLPELKPAA